MGPKFHETRMGARFFDAQLPRLITALEDIAKALAAQRAMPSATHQVDPPKDTSHIPNNALRDKELVRLARVLCDMCGNSYQLAELVVIDRSDGTKLVCCDGCVPQ